MRYAAFHQGLQGRIAQSVKCLATNVSVTADPRVAMSIAVRSHTFVDIDQEMIYTVILLLPSAESFKKGCCKYIYVQEVLVNCFFKLAQEKVW